MVRTKGEVLAFGSRGLLRPPRSSESVFNDELCNYSRSRSLLGQGVRIDLITSKRLQYTGLNSSFHPFLTCPTL